ncbi:MAG: G5 domain-containing protein [Clostridia bacterium]|nr:G5 domain-containing protein [Clostridia bacterium]
MLKKYTVVFIVICLAIFGTACSDNGNEEITVSGQETTVINEITTADTEETSLSNIEVKEEKKEEVIAFSTLTEYSDTLPEGSVATRVQGINGTKEIIYSVTFVDGEETERTVVSEKITKEPVSQVLLYGTQKAEPTTAEPTSETDSGENGLPARPEADLSKYAEGTVVSVQAVDDCDGSGHGYYMITLIDGTIEYQDY